MGTSLQEANPTPAIGTAADKAVTAFQDWVVCVDYREDVYKAIKAFVDTHPKLTGEDEKLLKETLRDYRRAGLELPPDKRKEVEELRKELAKLVAFPHLRVVIEEIGDLLERFEILHHPLADLRALHRHRDRAAVAQSRTMDLA